MFPGKVLLFGEYTVLRGGAALAAPSWSFTGSWNPDVTPMQELTEYLDHLKKKDYSFLNLESVDPSDMGFECSIPIGYGLGSSGAVTAAVYDKYRTDSDNRFTILKSRMAEMESYFHGKSSGLDPLISFLQKPIFSKGELIRPVEFKLEDLDIFLLDSGMARSTRPFVQLFEEKLQEEPFTKLVDSIWLPLVESSIDHLLENQKVDDTLWHQISEYQLEHLPFLIPNGIRDIWEQGLSSGQYAMKLCGAGGGGMFLLRGNPESLSTAWKVHSL